MNTYLKAGLAIALAAAAPSIGRADAAGFKTLYSFAGGNDGSLPTAGLVLDKAGSLYGTTELGGGHGAYGSGTVFKIAPDGSETLLYAFAAGGDGAEPYAGLYRDKKGNLYGTTIVGGGMGCYEHAGCGTVFKITPGGKEKILYAFAGGTADGSSPESNLISDDAGNLYGTTYQGGTDNAGTIFKLAPDGTETVLHSFASRDDGGLPVGGLIKDSAGNFYGTATEYGPSSAGTVYKLAADGTLTVIYSFSDTVACLEPFGSLKSDSGGNLYGTTFFTAGCLFKLAPDGTETTLYEFDGTGDGGFPEAGVIGNKTGTRIYGTNSGGPYDSGSVFRFENNTETVLHSFTGGSDGAAPTDPLVMGADGKLYGTTSGGGAHGDGTIFEVKD